MTDFIRRAHGGVTFTLLRKGSTRIKAPQPSVLISITSLTSVSSTDLSATFSNNRVSGTLSYAFSTSATALSQAACVNEIAVQKGSIVITESRLTPNTAYYLHWYYTDNRGVKSPTSTTNRSAGTVTTASGVVAPTAITPTAVTISEGQSIGSVFVSLTANQAGCTFSEIADASNKFTINSSGSLSLSASVLAANSPYTTTVRATNSAGSTDQVITVTVSAVVASSLTPDSTVTTDAALNALIASWIADPAGTTPAGKTTFQERVIQLTAPVASLTINAKVCPFPLVVRSLGPYDQSLAFPWKATSRSDVSGTVSLTNSTNIRLYGITASKFLGTANTDCMFERCAGQTAMADANTASGSVTGAAMYGLRFKVKDCLFTGYKDQVFYFNKPSATGPATAGSLNGFEFTGNILDKGSADAMKVAVSDFTFTGWKIERNWLGSDFLPTGTEHNDAYQHQAGFLDGLSFWGNVILQKRGKPGGTMNGGHFLSGTTGESNAVVRENIFVMSGVNAMGTMGGPGNDCSNNTLLYRNLGAVGTPQTGGLPSISGAWDTKSRNLIVTQPGTPAGVEGTNGLRLAIGKVDLGSVPDYTPLLAHFPAVPTETTYIDAIKPLDTSPAHWDYVGITVGAAIRSQEIWQYKMVPGNVGWPVAGYFHAEFDPGNTIGTSFSGVYDADGNNVPAITPFNFTMVDEEGSATMATWSGLRVKVNGGPWQTLASAGLSILSITPNVGPLIGGANPANTYDYSDKDRDGHGGEIFNAVDTAGGGGEIDNTGNSIQDGYIINSGGPKPVTPLLPGIPTIPTTQGATPVRAT